MPVELGGEFVHGRRPEVFEIAGDSGLLVERLPDTHFEVSGARWKPLGNFWKRVDRVTRTMRRSGRDRSIAEFLASRRRLPASDRRLVASLVEGYDAAPLDRASEHALSTAGEPERTADDRAQFRVLPGYSALAATRFPDRFAASGKYLFRNRSAR